MSLARFAAQAADQVDRLGRAFQSVKPPRPAAGSAPVGKAPGAGSVMNDHALAEAILRGRHPKTVDALKRTLGL